MNFAYVGVAIASQVTGVLGESGEGGWCSQEVHHNVTRYSVAKWNWCHVEIPFIVCVWLLVAAYSKIVFNIWPSLTRLFPDSSLLIVVGVLMGALFHVFGTESIDRSLYSLSPDLFFLFMLPPIVFEAGYNMPKRAFFDNFGSILMYAVIGTLWNTFAIGMSLYGVGYFIPELYTFAGKNFDFLHIMLFASLISAVDPVAVLVVFDEVNVNETLHITVFGESLLNDAVTVVLYNIFSTFIEVTKYGQIETIDTIAGVASFFVVGFGGIIVGLIYAVFAALSTKVCYHMNLKVVQPLLCLVIPYMAYLSAGMFSLSEILAIVTCGLVMKDYVKENISYKSNVTVCKMTHVLAAAAETIIFFFLGLACVNSVHTLKFDIGFIVLTIFFCTVYRVIGVFVLTAILNRFRPVKFTACEQIIMAYGGLRGAVAYGLAGFMPDSDVERKETYLATTIVVILFTVFVQGTTIKPLVKWLKIKTKDEESDHVFPIITERMLDHTLSGLEQICAFRGQHHFRHWFEHFNTQCLKPALTKEGVTSSNMRIVRAARFAVTKEAITDAQSRISRSLNHVIQQQHKLSSVISTSIRERPVDLTGIANHGYDPDDSQMYAPTPSTIMTSANDSSGSPHSEASSCNHCTTAASNVDADTLRSWLIQVDGVKSRRNSRVARQRSYSYSHPDSNYYGDHSTVNLNADATDPGVVMRL